MDGTFIKEFSSIRKAAVMLGNKHKEKHIGTALRKSHSAYGFQWKYASADGSTEVQPIPAVTVAAKRPKSLSPDERQRIARKQPRATAAASSSAPGSVSTPATKGAGSKRKARTPIPTDHDLADLEAQLDKAIDELNGELCMELEEKISQKKKEAKQARVSELEQAIAKAYRVDRDFKHGMELQEELKELTNDS